MKPNKISVALDASSKKEPPCQMQNNSCVFVALRVYCHDH